MICAQPETAVPSAQSGAESEVLLRAVQEISQAGEERILAHEKSVQSLKFHEIASRSPDWPLSDEVKPIFALASELREVDCCRW